MPSRTPLILFTLILLCFSIYANSLNNAFIGDDVEAIVDNPHISHPLYYWLQPNNFLNSVGYLIQGYNPFIQHFINIILHCINTILVFFLLRLFFKAESSLLGACIFATHPIHTEAVTWISGRYYLILTLFIITTYLLYYHSTNKVTPTNKRRKIFLYMFSLLIFSYFTANNIGFFSLTPFLLILSDITFNKWRKSWKLWIPFFIILTIKLILAREDIAGRIYYLANVAGGDLSWRNPVIYIPLILLYHFYILLLPLKLTFYYSLGQPSVIMLMLNIIIILFLAFKLPFIFKKSKELSFSIYFFIIFFAPIYSPIAVTGYVADRYLYLTSISLCIFLAFLYEKSAEKSQKARIITLSLLMLSMFLYSLRTIIRNEDWKTLEAFSQATIAVSNNSPLANNEIGEIYYKKGELDKAINLYKKAIELKPNYAEAYYNLGNVYNDLNKKDKAIPFYKKAIEFNPNYADAYNNLGGVYYDIDKKEEATALLKKAIEINPYHAGAYSNLGNVYNAIGRKDKAVILYEKAIELNPKFSEAYNNLGTIYYETGKTKEAISLYRKAIEINPDFAIAHNNLAVAYHDTNQYELAIKHCDKALQLGYKVEPALLKLLEPYRKK